MRVMKTLKTYRVLDWYVYGDSIEGERTTMIVGYSLTRRQVRHLIAALKGGE